MRVTRLEPASIGPADPCEDAASEAVAPPSEAMAPPSEAAAPLRPLGAVRSVAARLGRGPAGPDADAGRYRVERELGAGGMGRISLVRDLRLLREVAWKQGDWRLLREARILAQLEHPGIVPIYDIGFGPDGEPYFAMRVVRGESLAQRVRRTPASARGELLRPFLQAAEAVAYAHHRGVVHRDLKPANIMIGSFGESQVVDWGLARVLDDATDPIPEAVRLAVAGQDVGRVGTRGYMSPEQERGDVADRRSDVFGLGRILAEVVGPEVAPELAAIVKKATAGAPAERYSDAAALAADVAAYLGGQRVAAHAYRGSELLRRFVRAYRVPLAVAALALVALTVLGVVYVQGIGEEREVAQAAEARARAALARSDQALGRALVGEARRLAAQGARMEAEALAARALELGEDPDARGIVASLAGAPDLEVVARERLPCAESETDPTTGLVLCVASDGVALWGGEPLRALWSHRLSVRTARLVSGGVVVNSGHTFVAFDDRGHHLLTARSPNEGTRRTTTRGSVAVLESAKTSGVVDVLRGTSRGVKPCRGELHAALVPADDSTIGDGLAAVLCKDGHLRVGGEDAPKVPTELAAPEREATRMQLLRGGQVVAGTIKGEVAVLEGDGRVSHSRVLVSGMVRLLEVSPDGRFLVVAGEGDPIVVVTLPELARVGSLPRRAVTAVWDPGRSGELVTTGAWRERWRVRPAPPERPIEGAYEIPMRDGVVGLDVDPETPDRVAVAFGPYVGLLRPDRVVDALPGFITAKAAALRGTHVMAAGPIGLFRLDARDLSTVSALGNVALRRLVTLADGTSLVGGYSFVGRVVGDELVPVDSIDALDLSASPSRRLAIYLRESDHALVRVRADDPATDVVAADPLAIAVAIADDGDRVFTARPGGVAVWAPTDAFVFEHEADGAQLLDVEVAPDGGLIAAGARDGTVYLWRTGEASPAARFTDHAERVPALAFSSDSRWLASGSWDRTIRMRDLSVLGEAAPALAARLARVHALDVDEVLGAVQLPVDARLP